MEAGRDKDAPQRDGRDGDRKRKFEEHEVKIRSFVPEDRFNGQMKSAKGQREAREANWERKTQEAQAPSLGSGSSSSSSSSATSYRSLSPPSHRGESSSSASYSQSPNSLKQEKLYELLSKSIAPREAEHPRSSSGTYMKPKDKEKAETPKAQAARSRLERDEAATATGVDAKMPISVPGKLMLKDNPYAKVLNAKIPKSKRALLAEQVMEQQKEYFNVKQAVAEPPAVKKLGPLVGACLCGSVTWTFEGMPTSATHCNCTACRRYGALWAYNYSGENISIEGPTSTFKRGEQNIEFHFCASCGCMAFWRACNAVKGRHRVAVNLRMADPKLLERVSVNLFDGLHSGKSYSVNQLCVRDYFF